MGYWDEMMAEYGGMDMDKVVEKVITNASRDKDIGEIKIRIFAPGDNLGKIVDVPKRESLRECFDQLVDSSTAKTRFVLTALDKQNRLMGVLLDLNIN